ncbi:MAG: TrkA family potassium uptake protein [archaeon]
MANHFVICGCGRVGERLATTLTAHGENVTIIERDHAVVETEMKNPRFEILEGDPRNPVVLQAAGIETAKWIASVTADDKTNMIVCTLAKKLNKSIKVAVRVSSQEDLDVFMKLGVDLMVFPEIVAGIQLAEAILEKATPEHLATVASQDEVNKKHDKLLKFF